MKPKPGLLSPLIKSDVQGLLLARLFMNASEEFSVTELADYAFTSVPTAMREVDRLIEAEYVVERALGRVRLIRANQTHPLFEAIFQVVAFSYGPATLLPQALKGLFGLQQAFIFGDWANRLAQHPGPPPQQLSVLLVGNMNRIDASKSLARIDGKLGQFVNLQFVSADDWDRSSSEFIKTVKSSPLFELDLEI